MALDRNALNKARRLAAGCNDQSPPEVKEAFYSVSNYEIDIRLYGKSDRFQKVCGFCHGTGKMTKPDMKRYDCSICNGGREITR